MWTLCSLGSNLDPARNTASALRALVKWFGPLEVSPLIETDAVNVTGGGTFLNGLVRFQTDCSDEELKRRLNALETALGRDRNHPKSKTRPRPIDIDILCRADARDGLIATESTPYLDQMLASEADDSIGPRWKVKVDAALLGEEAATIHFDHSTGQVRIADQGPKGIQDGIQPAFAS